MTMTNKRRADLEQYFQREYLTPKELEEVRAELDRARSEEARLTEELRKKDETIKVLVDRLADIGAELGAIADHKKNPVSTNSALFQIAQQIESALRLAARED